MNNFKKNIFLKTKLYELLISNCFDVVIIGSGLAALSTAINISNTKKSIKIAIFTKDEFGNSNSIKAQGGIASAWSSSDSLYKHLNDTFKAGDYVGDKKSIFNLLNKSQKAIKFLIQNKIKLDKINDKYHLLKEGGHSVNRIFHNKDETGLQLIVKLMKIIKIKYKNQIFIFPHFYFIDFFLNEKYKLIHLITKNYPRIISITFSKLIIATGGIGQMFIETTNPEGATGDGLAIAYINKINFKNMNYYQYHPTTLYNKILPNFLITESLRGEGAHLKSINQNRFMFHYFPMEMELSTRDKISRAIFFEMEKKKLRNVWLDARHISEYVLKNTFKHIYTTLKLINYNLKYNLIPVVPAVHYLCGGVKTNLFGEIYLKNIYFIGEIANTGLHGANRLASNSLLEAILMGINIASKCIKIKKNCKNNTFFMNLNVQNSKKDKKKFFFLRKKFSYISNIVKVEKKMLPFLRHLYYSYEKLKKNNKQINNFIIEKRNFFVVSQLILISALKDRINKGTHFRSDV